jgi:hypothetical protein
VHMAIASPSARPSPFVRRVGIRIFTFEACSDFTHITARCIAQPPKAAFVTRLRPCQSPGKTARQLPDQSTTLWVEPSSTGDARLRRARTKREQILTFRAFPVSLNLGTKCGGAVNPERVRSVLLLPPTPVVPAISRRHAVLPAAPVSIRQARDRRLAGASSSFELPGDGSQRGLPATSMVMPWGPGTELYEKRKDRSGSHALPPRRCQPLYDPRDKRDAGLSGPDRSGEAGIDANARP